MMSQCVRFGALVLFLASSACATSSVLHTARPLPPGESRFTVAPSGYGFSVKDPEVSDASANLTLPYVDAMYRVGINDYVDFGIKVNSSTMMEADVNILLVGADMFALSFDPSISYIFLGAGTGVGDGAGYGFVWGTILADVVSTEGFVLTAALKPGYLFGTAAFGDDTSVKATPWAGGGLRAEVRLSDKFAIAPEFSAVTPLSDGVAGNLWLYNINLGFVF